MQIGEERQSLRVVVAFWMVLEGAEVLVKQSVPLKGTNEEIWGGTYRGIH